MSLLLLAIAIRILTKSPATVRLAERLSPRGARWLQVMERLCRASARQVVDRVGTTRRVVGLWLRPVSRPAAAFSCTISCRLALSVCVALALCSCRTASPTIGGDGAMPQPPACPAGACVGGPMQGANAGGENIGAMADSPAGMPDLAAVPGMTSPDGYGVQCPTVPGMELGVPLPYCPQSAWAPPGIAGPWPADEYICDGGDGNKPAEVHRDWTVRGVEMEDAIAHFDTVDGRRLIEPSNRVCIYSPRFRAVRQVVGLVAYDQRDGARGVEQPLRPARQDDVRPPLATKQQVQAEGKIAANPPIIVESKQGDGVLSTAVKALAFQDAFKAHENTRLMRLGEVEMAEMAFIAKGSQAAVAWETTQGVQVVLDAQAAAEVAKDQEALAVYSAQPLGSPRLRLCKSASTPFAHPGETVDFTLRFDNVGTQVIGNVTIIDNLSPRLEYVPDSAQCSRDAKFITQANAGQSIVLRCEIDKPLEPGQGGVIRFRCLVR